ncbi:MAG: bicyclomycin resistance protein [Betaproteobacteria bacterium]|nr:bicyclomycin resistance protein [Betaproteobacteria bacterium]
MMPGMNRRQALLHPAVATALAAWAGPLWPGPARPAPGLKVLRLASESETGFDPARVGDVRSLRITSHIFEPLLEFDPLARPVKLRPRTAAALPEPEPGSGWRVWTVRLQPGIFFTDDAAFGGQPRELVAADYAYSIQRLADPATRSPGWSSMEQAGISGLAARRREAVEGRQPFDYERPMQGLQVLDRHTLRFVLDAGRPRFPQWLASASTAAVAREVVEAQGELSMQHPVGTGPFVLAEWRRGSRIVLERNPRFRELRYHAEPAAGDAEGQAILARLQGRRLPMVDRVEVAIIEEKQPTWLAFLNGEADWVELPDGFTPVAMPGGRLAPHLARRGIRAERVVLPSTHYTMFNMAHPLVGGYTPERVALRRAIGLAIDVQREITLLRHGAAVPAQSPVAVHLSGYQPQWRSEMSAYNPARARALLDLYGWRDRDGDGWRETPEGRPLVLEMATQPSQEARRFDELMERDLGAIGLRVVFRTANWPEQYKAARAGKLMMWSVSGRASAPDGIEGLLRYDGAAAGGMNLSRFDLPEMNATIAKLQALPEGPEREALFDHAKRLTVAWMPYKLRTHLAATALTQPWLVGYRRPLFWNHWFETVDIEPHPRYGGPDA